MAKRSNSSSGTSNARRAVVSTVSGIVIVIIVLIVQAVLGVDIIPEEEDTGDGAPVAPVEPVEPIEPIEPVEPGADLIAAMPGGVEGDWYQIYYTRPLNTTDVADFAGAPLEIGLVTAISSAQQTLDAALFELNSQPVTDALIAAHQRGVTVRMVTDDDHGYDDPESTFDQIELAGIPVVVDNRGGLMHNKFLVIDGLYVWTGSTNITHNGIYNNNNNAILIRSSQLAANYTDEFEEMFIDQSFGITSDEGVINPSVTVDGTRIETYFEAEGDVPARLIELLNEAESVRFMAFSLTREDLFAPMIARQGVMDVEGIVEASSRRFVDDLYCAGIAVRQDGNPDILHHKVFIFDVSIVALGSFNFSGNAAENNDENLLIIHNPRIASAYLNEFERRWAEAEPMPADAFTCN